MTSVRKLILLLAPTLVGSSLLGWSPARAEAADTDGRAVAQCRAEVLRHFPAETVLSRRIVSITGNSRHTRVAMTVTTDRRYSFDCRTDAAGRVVTAAWNPPLQRRLAAAAAAEGEAPSR